MEISAKFDAIKSFISSQKEEKIAEEKEETVKDKVGKLVESITDDDIKKKVKSMSETVESEDDLQMLKDFTESQIEAKASQEETLIEEKKLTEEAEADSDEDAIKAIKVLGGVLNHSEQKEDK